MQHRMWVEIYFHPFRLTLSVFNLNRLDENLIITRKRRYPIFCGITQFSSGSKMRVNKKPTGKRVGPVRIGHGRRSFRGRGVPGLHHSSCKITHSYSVMVCTRPGGLPLFPFPLVVEADLASACAGLHNRVLGRGATRRAVVSPWNHTGRGLCLGLNFQGFRPSPQCVCVKPA